MSGRNDRLQACGRKRRYATRAEAKRFARLHRKKYGRLDVYGCDVCLGWHLGHSKRHAKAS